MSRPCPRPEVSALAAYRPPPRPARILLHANENPYPPPEGLVEEVLAELRRVPWNRYPDIEARELREAIADYAGLPADWVWVGTGSNEVLLEACQAYGGPGRVALEFPPTYAMHHRQAVVSGMSVATCPRGEGFAVDAEAALEAMERLQPAVVFLCTPNNPTGTLTPPEAVKRLARGCPGLFVVDEAYYEFCGQTFAGELASYPNVVVVRTLSKAFRLAGVRVGYVLACPQTLEPFFAVRMPYGQSVLAQVAARVALRRRDELLAVVARIVAERDRLAAGLAALPGVEVFPSAANFVLFRHPQAERILAGLAQRGILVRDFTRLPGAEGSLRVTVGRPEENDAFLEAMAELA